MTNGFQLVMPLDCEVNIEKNAPVRLLNAVMERMDYSKLYAAYSRLGRIEYSPKILLKIMVYGYMRKQISSRALEACCRENLHFIYLLEGQCAPDHNTINRFRKNILTQEAGQDILRQLVIMLHERGLLSLEAAFIDGTKIEANANKYSFVWKKATAKKTDKLLKRIHEELPAKLKEVGIRFYIPEKIAVRQLKKLRKRIYARIDADGIVLVSGKGKRKTPIQRLSEWIDQCLAKLKQYTKDIHICGNRNSFSKTDHDATFMHMKEDYMRNGQLKPGYNVNVATCSDFIIGSYISSDRNDVHTLIPFMEQLRKNYAGRNIGSVVVDSGYESEENYCWFEAHPETELYVKPSTENTEPISAAVRIWSMTLKQTPIPVPTESCCKEHGKRKRIRPLGWKSPHRSMNATNATDAHLKKSASVHAAVRSPWKNDTKSSMCQNALPDSDRLWKQRSPLPRDVCFG